MLIREHCNIMPGDLNKVGNLCYRIAKLHVKVRTQIPIPILNMTRQN